MAVLNPFNDKYNIFVTVFRENIYENSSITIIDSPLHSNIFEKHYERERKGKLMFYVFKECACFPEFLQKFMERHSLWSLCSVVFHAFTDILKYHQMT